MLDTLTNFVTVLLALSVATERLVDLVKGFIPALNGAEADPSRERWRQWGIQLISVGAAAAVVWLAQGYILTELPAFKDPNGATPALNQAHGVLLAILASGGSSMWNSILSYLLSLKNIKQQDAEAVTNKGSKGNADLFAALPATMPAL